MSEAVDQAKQAVGYAAADLVESGMRVGLGTGSTFVYVLDRLAERMREEKLELLGVPTSEATATRARELAIPLTSLDEVEVLDLAIDGADEVDPAKNLIKGGGGALVREKIVASAAPGMIVIVGENKMVDRLGATFLLPVEMMAFGRRQVAAELRKLDLEPTLRQNSDGEPYRTDNGNMIYDCKLGPCEDLGGLEIEINAIPGVLDNGLFIDMAEKILIGDEAGNVRVVE
ncbi:MAG: ribose-5-phosphate isomerase RpiA [Planctomycetota bacterium]|jgi:ribose 5-phosphate isomerase A